MGDLKSRTEGPKPPASGGWGGKKFRRLEVNLKKIKDLLNLINQYKD